jgi:hypothetical protein
MRNEIQHLLILSEAAVFGAEITEFPIARPRAIQVIGRD